MSQKTEKPVLSGQRIKTRKRDEKEKFDTAGFRDVLLQGLLEAGTDLEAVSKYLDSNKLDYRRYGETLFDVLIAGGILGPGGVTPGDGGKLAPACVFAAENTVEALKGYEQVFLKLMRRYKYLEKMLIEEMQKVFTYMKRFSEEDRCKLAKITALWLSNGTLTVNVMNVIATEHLVKDNLALDFLLEVLVTWKNEKGISSVISSLKKFGLDYKLMEFFPPNKRTQEHFQAAFEEKGLSEIIKLQKAQANQEVKKDFQKFVSDLFAENRSVKEMITQTKEFAANSNLADHDVVPILWSTIMGSVEWNKKDELVAEQALKHLKNYAALLGAFCETPKAEITLMLRIQDYCYDNMNFMKVFQKIIFLLYKTDVLTEESILRWYRTSHGSKGKSVFLDQLKKFVEWLQNAEEESESSDED